MMVSIGHENFLNSNDIVAIIKPDCSPAKKLRHGANADRMLISATSGRKARSMIVMKSNHVVLSALQTETLKTRIDGIKITDGLV